MRNVRTFFEALNVVRNSVSRRTADKADRIFRGGRVYFIEELPSENEVFLFKVRGDHDEYQVKLEFSEVSWNYSCGCQTRGYYCSHLLASLFYIEKNFLTSSQVRNAIEEPEDRIDDYMSSYSNDRVDIAIIGSLYGIEIEYNNDRRELWRIAHKDLKNLKERGWRLKRDGSIPNGVEIVSPIMMKDELLNVSEEKENLFKLIAQKTKQHNAGIHTHIAFDDMFSVGKIASNSTLVFLKNLIVDFEKTFLNDEEVVKKVFGRTFTGYADRWEENNVGERYVWINLNGLGRRVGKTIEIRLFSSKYAGRIPHIIEVTEIIGILLKNALRDWRKAGRPSYNEWKAQKGKILPSILNKKDLIRLLSIFKPEALRKIS